MHVSLVQSYHHDCTWLKEKARCVQGSIVTLPGCLTCSIDMLYYSPAQRARIANSHQLRSGFCLQVDAHPDLELCVSSLNNLTVQACILLGQSDGSLFFFSPSLPKIPAYLAPFGGLPPGPKDGPRTEPSSAPSEPLAFDLPCVSSAFTQLPKANRPFNLLFFVLNPFLIMVPKGAKGDHLLFPGPLGN